MKSPVRSRLSGQFLSAVLAALVSTTVAPWQGVAAQPASAAREASLPTLEIVSGTRTHKFHVEVVQNDEQRARGLMYRRYLPADRGMLFDFEREEPIQMWMKNTYIPLDMIFIDRRGKIISIAEDTEPLSERIIPSGGKVLAVLEVNGGTARRLGIRPGDRVSYRLFH